MYKFKAPDGTRHYLDDLRFVFLLPSGSVEMSDEEEAEIIAKENKST